LFLSNSQLHLVDLNKSFAEIWEHWSKIFGEKVVNAKFSLKMQIFKLKMHQERSLSTHINELKSITKEMTKIGNEVDDEYAKAILLNNLSSNCDNVNFTLPQLSTRTLDEMIAALLVEEKRMKEGDT
jgi:hypothetical protein